MKSLDRFARLTVNGISISATIVSIDNSDTPIFIYYLTTSISPLILHLSSLYHQHSHLPLHFTSLTSIRYPSFPFTHSTPSPPLSLSRMIIILSSHLRPPFLRNLIHLLLPLILPSS